MVGVRCLNGYFEAVESNYWRAVEEAKTTLKAKATVELRLSKKKEVATGW